MNGYKGTIVVDKLPTELGCTATWGNPRPGMFLGLIILLGAGVLLYMGYFDKAKAASPSTWSARKSVTNTPSAPTAASPGSGN